MITNQVQFQFSKLLLVVLTTSTVVATGRGAQKIVQTIKTSSKISVPQVKQHQSTNSQIDNNQVQGVTTRLKSISITPSPKVSISPLPSVSPEPKLTATPKPTYRVDDSFDEHLKKYKEDDMDDYYEEYEEKENELKYKLKEDYEEEHKEEKKLKEYFEKERKEYFEEEHKEDRD